jgi:ribonuclease P protein component
MDRLRQRKDFLAAAKGGRTATPGFVVQRRAREDDCPVRIGFTVSRKVGTATERNRVRRRLREVVKRLDPISMRPHSDYVLVGRRDALGRDFATMVEDLRTALIRLERPTGRGERPPGGKTAPGRSAARRRRGRGGPDRDGNEAGH